jgi:hypothetical protein
MLKKLSPFLQALAAAAIAVLGALGLQLARPPAPPPPTYPTPPTNPGAQPPVPPEVKPDPLAAIGRIQFGNAGCTATIIGTKRVDKRHWVLTAAHCIQGVGQRGTMRLRDGREFGISVQSYNTRADCAWLLTDPMDDRYPFALLAAASPEPGEPIWHAGFGVHQPSNREEGVVVAKQNGDGQIQFRLSVSSGDSGGGIAVNKNGEIVSTVCCTTEKGRMADVWGASPESIRALRPEANALDHWTPLDIPIKTPTPQRMPAEAK